LDDVVRYKLKEDVPERIKQEIKEYLNPD